MLPRSACGRGSASVRCHSFHDASARIRLTARMAGTYHVAACRRAGLPLNSRPRRAHLVRQRCTPARTLARPRTRPSPSPEESAELVGSGPSARDHQGERDTSPRPDQNGPQPIACRSRAAACAVREPRTAHLMAAHPGRGTTGDREAQIYKNCVWLCKIFISEHLVVCFRISSV